MPHVSVSSPPPPPKHSDRTESPNIPFTLLFVRLETSPLARFACFPLLHFTASCFVFRLVNRYPRISVHGSHAYTMSTHSCSQPSSPALAETPQLICTETNARPSSPTDPVLAKRDSGTSTSSVDISLCTPYSPTALSEFDFIAKTFPLPLDRDQQEEVIRDDVSDFPVEIPLLGEETDEIAGADLRGFDSLHGSQSWAREDLALWRSRCHLSGTSQSTTSLPATLTILPPSTSKRNSSSVSLPMSLPDLTDSTATSTTFNWSATGDSDWPSGSSQPPTMAKQRSEKEPDLLAQNVNMSDTADAHSESRSERYIVWRR